MVWQNRVRTYFLSIDRPQYKYYEFVKQLIWIVLSAGLVGAYLKRRDTDDFNFLSLAVFGGLLFLTIFEGGKTREHICAWTGYTLVDLDHIAPERMAATLTLICADKHTLMAYTTISGHGIRIICRIDDLNRVEKGKPSAIRQVFQSSQRLLFLSGGLRK